MGLLRRVNPYIKSRLLYSVYISRLGRSWWNVIFVTLQSDWLERVSLHSRAERGGVVWDSRRVRQTSIDI